MLANAVKDNDRIVHRVPKNGEECDRKERVYLCTGEVTENGVKACRNNDVVEKNYDHDTAIYPRRDWLRYAAECPCDVEHDGCNDRKKRIECLLGKFRA